MGPSPASQVCGEIIKSPADKLNYRGIVLPNKLKVLLISDPDTDKAAAAMSVAVGSLSNPPELPGLAHLCEHMLFLGSQKFPIENEYRQFLSENGGHTNAITKPDHTDYFFDVNSSELKPALDKFAQFFICPLFTESATEREVNVVHSEHEQSMSDDVYRVAQAIQLCSKQGHPYSLFTCGNRETLWNIPRKQGIDIRSALMEFYNQHYSSNIMTLTVLGNESLDDLQSLVDELFNSVQNKNVPMPFWPESPYGLDNLPRLLEVTPIKENRFLRLHFPIPYTVPFYKTKPERYLSYLIEHEGPGSLLLLLKESNLASSVSFYAYSRARGFAFLNVQIELTPEGFNQWEQVVQNVFEYIRMLKETGPQKWIWDELKLCEDTFFRFYNKLSSRSLVSNTSPSMLIYNVEEVLSHDFTLSEYKPELISQFLECLTPTNVLIALVSPVLSEKTPLVDEFYGVHYNITDLPNKLIQKWESCERNCELKLPLKNDFIPSEFTIKPRTEKEGCIAPKILMDTDLSRVRFLQDMEFLSPKGVFYLSLENRLPGKSALNLALIHLYKRMLDDALQHELYPATFAGLSYTVLGHTDDLLIDVDGFDQKLTEVMERIINTLLNFKLDKKRFEIVKDKFVRELRDSNNDEPSSLIYDHLNHVMDHTSFVASDFLQIVDDLTPQNLEKFVSQFLDTLKLEFLFYGNWVTQDALSAAEKIQSLFKERGTKPPSFESIEYIKDVKIKSGTNLLLKRETKTHNSSAALVYFQMGLGEPQYKVTCELLVQILKEPFFDQLRTKECLGYDVNAHTQHAWGMAGLVLLVQGEKHPAFLETRIDNFLNTTGRVLLEEMTDEQFEKHKSNLAATLAPKPLTIYERANVIRYESNSLMLKLEQLKTITLNEMQTAYKNLVSTESHRRLDIHVVSFAKDGAGNKKIDGDSTSGGRAKDEIDDMVSWKLRHTYNNRPEPTNPVDSISTGGHTNEPKTIDEFEAFGIVVACKLRRLHALDKKAASACEIEVLKVIHETEMQVL